MFKFITPAWSNNNLRNLGDYIYSNLIMAHVRAASSGHDHTERVIVSNENCHPFKFGRWTFMHNGGNYFRNILICGTSPVVVAHPTTMLV